MIALDFVITSIYDCISFKEREENWRDTCSLLTNMMSAELPKEHDDAESRYHKLQDVLFEIEPSIRC